MKYIIQCTLLSDTLPASGEGISGSVDMDIHYDDDGIPYIPGKRLKGILREQAEALEEIVLQHSVNELFGTEGNDSLTNFKLGNGKIKNYDSYRRTLSKVEEELKRSLSREEVLAWFTTVRAGTTIELDSGVAQRGTLRTMRLLRKGLVFEFPLQLDHKYKKDFELLCKATTHLGVSRTRGLGNIRLELKKAEKEEATRSIIPQNIPSDANVFRVRFRNIEPLLITSEVGKNQKTMNFVPGSMIRGALNYLFIRQNNLTNAHENQDFRHIFLDGNVQFLPAFPVINGQRSLPSPACIVKEKDKKNYFNMLSEDKESVKKDEILTKGNLKSFFIHENNTIYHRSPDTFIEYHHRRPADKELGSPTENDGEFFQFEILAPGQEFEFVLKGAMSDLKKIADVLGQEQHLYLGKSKSAQYGLCEIIDAKFERENDIKMSLSKEDEVHILCESDLIVRNRNGYPEPSLDAFKFYLHEHFPEFSDLQPVYDKSYLKVRFIGGFRGVWRLERPHVQAIASGSVITLKNEGEKEVDVSELFNELQGYYTEEGFGKLVPFPLENKSIKSVTVSDPPDEKNDNNQVATENIIKEFADYLHLQSTLQSIRRSALENGKKNNLSISNSLISFLYNGIRNVSTFAEWHNLLSDLRRKKFDALEKVKTKLFLEKKNNSQSFSINKDKFTHLIREKLTRSEWLNDDEMVFRFYKEYMTVFLSVIRFKKRGVKDVE